MSKLSQWIRLGLWPIWKDRQGQDLIEYALLAGFIAVGAVAVMPGIASSIDIVYSKVNSVMILAASS